MRGDIRQDLIVKKSVLISFVIFLLQAFFNLPQNIFSKLKNTSLYSKFSCKDISQQQVKQSIESSSKIALNATNTVLFKNNTPQKNTNIIKLLNNLFLEIEFVFKNKTFSASLCGLDWLNSPFVDVTYLNSWCLNSRYIKNKTVKFS